MKITFHQQARVTLRHKNLLKAFIERMTKKEKTMFESLTFIFCTDEYLLEINRSYLKHDYYTDIITFDLSENISSCIGELYISIDRVKDNANTHAADTNTELHRVIFHGILHLCGYGDKSEQEIVIMRRKENYYLRQYFAIK